jgi:hypothetical protein
VCNDGRREAGGGLPVGTMIGEGSCGGAGGESELDRRAGVPRGSNRVPSLLSQARVPAGDLPKAEWERIARDMKTNSPGEIPLCRVERGTESGQ